jgi:hypothetical protein
MADFIITIPDPLVTDVIEAMCDRYGYQDIIHTLDGDGSPTDIPNPQTKGQFAKESLRKVIREAYITYKAKVDVQATMDTAKADATTDADAFTNN